MTCDRSCSQAKVCGVSETAARRHDQRPAVAAPPEAQPVVQPVPRPEVLAAARVVAVLMALVAQPEPRHTAARRG